MQIKTQFQSRKETDNMKFLIYRKNMNKLPIHFKAKNRKKAEEIAKEMFPNEYVTILTLG